MKIIVTALRQEALPIIEALRLKQDVASRRIPVYSGGDTILVISGMGKLLAAIATTHAMHLSGMSENRQLINVGMCGAVVDQIALGETVTVHKIWDHASGREFFPDMLVNYGLQEASLGTFDQPVTTANRPILACEVVDMEASGIYQAAQFFVSPHQMLFLKVATDYLEFSSDDYAQMRRYFNQSVDDWIPILKDFERLSSRPEVISVEQEAFLNSVAKSMRLTKTQTHQLRVAAMGFLVRGGSDLQIIQSNVASHPEHKVLRNQMFELMIQALNK